MVFAALVSKISLTVALLTICMTLAIMLEYIGRLHARMNITNKENMRLLDGMHEGLLIVKKEEQKVIMFCNRPAQKLFHGAISKIVEVFDKNGNPVNPLLQNRIF